MKPFIVLSHGLESGPDATKVRALAGVADALGLANVRPDYLDLDASRDVSRIDERVDRLKAQVPSGTPVILAGSSMGAYISALASSELNCVGLFLIALPLAIPGYARTLQAARVPTVVVHGWQDAICPADAAIAFARARGDTMVLLADDHRLGGHVDVIAEHFRAFLGRFT